MSEVSNTDLLKSEVGLNSLWEQARTLLAAPYKDFDKNYEQAHLMRRIELLKISNEMSVIVQSLCGANLYLTTSGRGDDYQRLEKMMVQAIGRISRLDADQGIVLRKKFLNANRSFSGSIKVRLVAFFGRIHYWFDDNNRSS